MEKTYAIIFLFLLYARIQPPDNVFIVNETTSEVMLKLIYEDHTHVEPYIEYKDMNNDTNKKREILDQKERSKSIIILPDEKITIACSRRYDYECPLEAFTDNRVIFVEITHLGSKKKIKWTVNEFYSSRHWFLYYSVYIKESLFE